MSRVFMSSVGLRSAAAAGRAPGGDLRREGSARWEAEAGRGAGALRRRSDRGGGGGTRARADRRPPTRPRVARRRGRRRGGRGERRRVRSRGPPRRVRSPAARLIVGVGASRARRPRVVDRARDGLVETEPESAVAHGAGEARGEPLPQGQDALAADELDERLAHAARRGRGGPGDPSAGDGRRTRANLEDVERVRARGGARHARAAHDDGGRPGATRSRGAPPRRRAPRGRDHRTTARGRVGARGRISSERSVVVVRRG